MPFLLVMLVIGSPFYFVLFFSAAFMLGSQIQVLNACFTGTYILKGYWLLFFINFLIGLLKIKSWPCTLFQFATCCFPVLQLELKLTCSLNCAWLSSKAVELALTSQKYRTLARSMHRCAWKRNVWN